MKRDCLVNKFLFGLLATTLSLSTANASSGVNTSKRVNQFEVEAGILHTNKIEIQGYQQNIATNGWKSNDITARFEYWSKTKDSWNFGTVFQPIYTQYQDTVTSNLNYQKTVFESGSNGTLKFQFHSIRQSANYPVLQSELGYLRLGGSFIVRYAQLDFTAGGNSFSGSGWIAIPLFNVESEIVLTPKYSFFTRSDFLPSPTQGLFVDGLYDCLFAVRSKIGGEKSVDIGVRLFFGGYDPQQAGKYANRIFLSALVARYRF